MAKYKLTFPVFDGNDVESYYADDDQKAKEYADGFLKGNSWDANPNNQVWDQSYILERFDVKLGYYIKVGTYVVTIHA